MVELLNLILSLFKKDPEKVIDPILVEDREELSIIPTEANKAIKKIVPISYKNDSQRLKNEHLQLVDKNPALYNILSAIDDYVWEKYKKNIVITMIYRTQAEQDYLYRNSEKYKKRKFKSPHQFYDAIDVRSFIFTQDEIDDIVAWINSKYNNDNYYAWTAKCHSVGSGYHFHIQFVRP